MARYLLLTPAEQNQYDQRHKQILDLLRQLAAVDAAEVSKLSAKMVELSLQETHRDPSLRDTITDEHGAVRSPLLWPSTNVQRIARPPFEKAGTMEPVVRKPAIAPPTLLNRHQIQRTAHVSKFAVLLYSRATVIVREMTTNWCYPAAMRNLRERWKSVQRNQRLVMFRRGIFSPLTVAAERSIMRLRTGLWIKHLSRRTATAAESVADRISCSKVYHCRDCANEVGVRSHPRTFIERYILPLLLMQPVRCADCFRRDYWLIFTGVRERSHRGHETVDHIHRNIT